MTSADDQSSHRDDDVRTPADSGWAWQQQKNLP